MNTRRMLTAMVLWAMQICIGSHLVVLASEPTEPTTKKYLGIDFESLTKQLADDPAAWRDGDEFYYTLSVNTKRIVGKRKDDKPGRVFPPDPRAWQMPGTDFSMRGMGEIASVDLSQPGDSVEINIVYGRIPKKSFGEKVQEVGQAVATSELGFLRPLAPGFLIVGIAIEAFGWFVRLIGGRTSGEVMGEVVVRGYNHGGKIYADIEKVRGCDDIETGTDASGRVDHIHLTGADDYQAGIGLSVQEKPAK